jgi:hypothetical protein
MKTDNVEDVYEAAINSKPHHTPGTQLTVSAPAAYNIAEAPCICSTVFGYVESPCSTSSSCVAMNDGFTVPFSYIQKSSSFWGPDRSQLNHRPFFDGRQPVGNHRACPYTTLSSSHAPRSRCRGTRTGSAALRGAGYEHHFYKPYEV